MKDHQPINPLELEDSSQPETAGVALETLEKALKTMHQVEFKTTLYALTFFHPTVDRIRPNAAGNRTWHETKLCEVVEWCVLAWRDHKYRWIPRIIAMDINIDRFGRAKLPKWRELKTDEERHVRELEDEYRDLVMYRAALAKLDRKERELEEYKRRLNDDFPPGDGDLDKQEA